jgi:hypothetical protein
MNIIIIPDCPKRTTVSILLSGASAAVLGGTAVLAVAGFTLGRNAHVWGCK